MSLPNINTQVWIEEAFLSLASLQHHRPLLGAERPANAPRNRPGETGGGGSARGRSRHEVGSTDSWKGRAETLITYHLVSYRLFTRKTLGNDALHVVKDNLIWEIKGFGHYRRAGAA